MELTRRIVCAYIPEEWHVIMQEEAVTQKDVGRKVFEGVEAPREILTKLQSVEERLCGKFGARAAVAYASLDEIDEWSSY